MPEQKEDTNTRINYVKQSPAFFTEVKMNPLFLREEHFCLAIEQLPKEYLHFSTTSIFLICQGPKIFIAHRMFANA